MEEKLNHPLLFSIGVNYRTSPLEVREKLSITESELPVILEKYKTVLDECFIISTCNRTEIYGVAASGNIDRELIKNILIDFKNARDIAHPAHFFEYVSCGAVNHLFRVATSIDSMVVGDVQIMHQLKEFYLKAKETNSTGKILNQLCQKALHTGKRAKNETSLYEGAFSVSFAAVELAMKIFGDLDDMTVMVIGAGETAELTAKNLIRKNVKKLLVTNRTRANAESMIETLKHNYNFEQEVVEFEEFKQRITEADIVISSTASKDYILMYDEFKKIIAKRKDVPILIIDIAIPRDIDPDIDKLDNVFLKNIDALNEIVNSDYEKRMKLIPDVKDIITEELIEYLVWYYSIPLIPAIQHIQKNSANGNEAKKRLLKFRDVVIENISEMHRKVLKDDEGFTMDDIHFHFELLDKLLNLSKLTIQEEMYNEN